jgi:hypothetical protein
VVDLDVVLQRVRGHPSLPEAPPLDAIVALARRRRAQRAGSVLVLAAVVVALISSLTSGDGGSDGELSAVRHAPSESEGDALLVPAIAETPRSTRPPTTTVPAQASTTTEPETTTTAEDRPTTTSPPQPEAAPQASPDLTRSVRIEDTATGTGVGTIEYSGGSWTRCGGCNVATSDSSYHYGFEAGQSYTVRFRGMQLKIYAPSDKHGGVARVTVDGQPAATPTVDFLTSGTQVNGLRWDSGVLADGVHEVVFTIQPGTNEVVLFDRADVYSP